MIQTKIPGDSEKQENAVVTMGECGLQQMKCKFSKTRENMVSKGRSGQLLGIHNFPGKLKFIG